MEESVRSSPRSSCCRLRGSVSRNGVNRDPVFMKFGNGQSQGIDELILRINLGLIADLLRIQIVGQAEHPVLGPRLMRMGGSVDAIKRHKRRTASHHLALNHLLRE